MKLSARDQIKGTVIAVRKGQTTGPVRLGVGHGIGITVLEVGDPAMAVIKATHVMVAK